MQGNYTDSDINDLSNEVTNPGMSGVGRSASDEERCNALYNLEVTDFIVIRHVWIVKTRGLLNSYALCQITRLIDISSQSHGTVISINLKRNSHDHALHKFIRLRGSNHMISKLIDSAIY